LCCGADEQLACLEFNVPREVVHGRVRALFPLVYELEGASDLLAATAATGHVVGFSVDG